MANDNQNDDHNALRLRILTLEASLDTACSRIARLDDEIDGLRARIGDVEDERMLATPRATSARKARRTSART